MRCYIEDKFCKIVIFHPEQIPSDQSPENFLQACKEYLSRYFGGDNTIQTDVEKFTITIAKTAAFEKSLDALGKVIQLHEIAQYGNPKDLKELLKGTDINTTNLSGETPLISAAYANNVSNAEFLLEQKTDINHKDKGGATALHIAVGQYSKDPCECINTFPMVELLLKKGINVSIETNKGETALHVANRVGDDEVASLIIDKFREQNPNYSEGQLKQWVDDATVPVEVTTTQKATDTEKSSPLSVAGHFSRTPQAVSLNTDEDQEQKLANLSLAN